MAGACDSPTAWSATRRTVSPFTIFAPGCWQESSGTPEFTLGDGAHPNAAGMQRIAAAMWPYVEPLLK